MKNKLRALATKWGVCVLVFFVAFGIYLANLPFDYHRNLKNHDHRRIYTSLDIISNTFLPYALIKHKTITFNPIIENIRYFYNKPVPYYTAKINGNFVSKYPILTGIIAVPIYLPAILLNKIPDMSYLSLMKIGVLGRITASFYMALGTAIMYKLFSRFCKDKKKVLIFTFFYAFGTNTWTISSRALWTQTSSQLIIILILFNIITALEKPEKIKWLGLLNGLAVVARPTNFVLPLVLSVYVFLRYKKYFVKYIMYAIPTVLILLGYNQLAFGNPLYEGYQANNDAQFSGNFLQGLIGILFSPGKGFLFTSAPLILGFVPVLLMKKMKSAELKTALFYLQLVVIAALFMVCFWRDWTGADRFGYALMTEYTPILSLVAFIRFINFKKAGVVLVSALAIFSIYVHTNAVVFRKSRCDPKHTWGFYCLMPPKRLPKY